jgi:tetratricopeptide (TPR) repeat protein
MFNPLSKLEKAFQRQPQEPLFARLADTYLKKGQVDKALELCLEGCGHFSDYSTGFQVLSKCHFQQGDFEAARGALDKALRLDPENPAGYVQLSHIYRELGNPVLALKSLQQAANFDPLSLSLAREVDQLSYQVEPASSSISALAEYEQKDDSQDRAVGLDLNLGSASRVLSLEETETPSSQQAEFDEDALAEGDELNDVMAESLGLGDERLEKEEEGMEPPSLSQEELDVLLGGDTDDESDEDGGLDDFFETEEMETENGYETRQEYQELASLGSEVFPGGRSDASIGQGSPQASTPDVFTQPAPLYNESQDLGFIGDLANVLSDEPEETDAAASQRPSMPDDSTAAESAKEHLSGIAGIPGDVKESPDESVPTATSELLEEISIDKEYSINKEYSADAEADVKQDPKPSVDFSTIWAVGLDAEIEPPSAPAADIPLFAANEAMDHGGLSVDPDVVISASFPTEIRAEPSIPDVEELSAELAALRQEVDFPDAGNRQRVEQQPEALAQDLPVEPGPVDGVADTWTDLAAISDLADTADLETVEAPESRPNPPTAAALDSEPAAGAIEAAGFPSGALAPAVTDTSEPAIDPGAVESSTSSDPPAPAATDPESAADLAVWGQLVKVAEHTQDEDAGEDAATTNATPPSPSVVGTEDMSAALEVWSRLVNTAEPDQEGQEASDVGAELEPMSGAVDPSAVDVVAELAPEAVDQQIADIGAESEPVSGDVDRPTENLVAQTESDCQPTTNKVAESRSVPGESDQPTVDVAAESTLKPGDSLAADVVVEFELGFVSQDDSQSGADVVAGTDQQSGADVVAESELGFVSQDDSQSGTDVVAGTVPEVSESIEPSLEEATDADDRVPESTISAPRQNISFGGKPEERGGGLKASGDNQLIELFREIQSQPQSQSESPSEPVSLAIAASEEEQRIATVTLAEIYAHQGLTQRATETYRQILAVDPENEDIQRKLAALEQRL